MNDVSGAELAPLIDHTILKPDATRDQIVVFCDEAKSHGFRSVCVNSVHAAFVAEQLAGTAVKVCSVIGFPLGAMPSVAKAYETEIAVASGAQEIDMVIQIGALKEGRLDDVRDDIKAVRMACPSAVLKVIIETCLLTDQEKRDACRLSVEAGADFVKTSTGFAASGATVEDIKLMRSVVGPNIGVKASGGVRTVEGAQAMIAAGATRIGTSSGVALVTRSDAPVGAY